MRSERTRVAIIGSGFITGNYHLPALVASGAQVVGLADVIPQRAQALAAEYAVPVVTGDYRELLERSDVEAVVIATPDCTHAEIAIDALQAGKAVLLQKPMARNSAECRRILEAARRSGSPLYVSFMHRYLDEVVALQHLLKSEALGSVFYVRQTNAKDGIDYAGWFYSRECVGGGVVNQLGVHGLYLLLGLFGNIEWVRADVRQLCRERRLRDGSVVPQDNDDVVIATYRFSGGLIATHEINFCEVAGTSRFRTEVHGLEGVAHLRTERGPLALYAPKHTGQTEWVTPEFEMTPYGVRHHRHFLAMVRGEEPPDSTANEALVCALITEAVYRSGETRQWEAVERP